MEDKKQKVLLIKLSSLGDVIFNIPLANALKGAGFEVTWLVSEKGVQVVENNPCVDKTILVPLEKWKKRGLSFESFKEYLNIIQQIRAEKFDIAIDAQMMFKSLYWMMFCGAKRRIISKKARELSVLGGNEWVGEISYKPEYPIILNYLKYAHHLGIDINQVRVTLPMRDDTQIKIADELLVDSDKEKPTIVIAPATTWPHKHWNKDNWRTVINNIEQNCNLIFTGSSADNELIEYISGGKGINLAGKTDIIELMEVFSRADVVIAPDSGSAHLAWATGKPAVIVLFTCTSKIALAPYGDNKKYFALGGEGLPCQPCRNGKCKLHRNIGACTNFPNPKDVVELVNSLIFK